MQRGNSLPRSWRLRAPSFFLTALLVVVADQQSKSWIRSILAVGESMPETGFLRLAHVQNTGSAFGLFQDQALLLTIVAFIGIAALLFFGLFGHRRFPSLVTIPAKLALGLILGGTVGNLIDRLNYGYVTDFIAIGYWPTFNIADSTVVVGAILIAYLLIRLTESSEHRNGQSI
ncbi:MAG: signal peptidase II [Dehalococcoidales bacterium]|jgi:signal peptidase II|nr:signal peptidase II [Dehalococcoidales bacterium]|tara:strand:- start:545 stop:1066 length:522 start_codon:yes stop_codon:yes gene_type:complete